MRLWAINSNLPRHAAIPQLFTIVFPEIGVARVNTYMNDFIGFVYAFSGMNGEGLYVGATARPWVRPNENEAALHAQRHWNINFQAAFNEFGLESFAYILSEPVAGRENLARLEEALIAQAKAEGEKVFNKQARATIHHPVGYSLSEETRQRQSISKRKNYRFRAPDGSVHEPSGLKAFCQTHGLTMSEMSRVANGIKRIHKGWSLAEPLENA